MTTLIMFNIYIYVCMCVCMYVCICVYVYIDPKGTAKLTELLLAKDLPLSLLLALAYLPFEQKKLYARLFEYVI